MLLRVQHTFAIPHSLLIPSARFFSLQSLRILCGLLALPSSFQTHIDPDHTPRSLNPASLIPSEIVHQTAAGARIMVRAFSNITLATIMFPAPRAPSPRQRSASCSTDDQSSIKDRPRRLFNRYYAHDLSMSSQSLATTNSQHDDLPTPSVPTHPSHTTSTHSTPMTSPSTGYSSLFPGSLSSATSESAPSAESKYRSEFGMLIPGSSSYLHGSASSRSSHPVSPWSRSRSTTESEPRTSAPYIPFGQFSSRPVTAPNSPPILPIPSSVDSSPADHHTRSHSRLTVSIKNLFSRHVGPSPSRFSLNSATTGSAPSHSDASSSSFQLPVTAGKWSMTPQKSRPPDLEISGAVAPAVSSPGRGSNSPIDAHRRFASEATVNNARTGNGLPTRQESIDVSCRNVPPTRGRDPKTRNVLRRRPSGAAKLLKGRERGMSSPSPRPNEGDADHLHLPSNEIHFPLTPAGAVVEAYKQQELHRDDTPSPPKLSIDDPMSLTASYVGNNSPTPYYTVFGMSSERRVRAGGPDDRWGRFEPDHRVFTRSQATLSHQPSMSDPGSRSLTRKLSNRWRKSKGGVAPDESPLRDKGHSKGRPSLQDIWAADKSSLRSTGQSMDGPSNARDGAWASPSGGHARSRSKADKNDGPKLWRLMRRISTGGLRDRFQSDKAVPPVPAIPKELLNKVNQDEPRNDYLLTSRHQASASSPDKDHSRTSIATRNIAVAQPNAATSSSSPNSDVASTQFFHKTHSARSSVSSYGEAVVLRLPEPMLDRHIITPLEQLRLGDDHVEGSEPNASLPVSRSPRRSTSVPSGLRTVEDAEGDYVPLPSPRRQTCPGETPSAGSSRPCSTALSASGSARGSYQSPGAVIGQSRMADGTVSLSPPPRPPKNATRGGGSVASSPSHSMVVKQVDSGVGIWIGGVRQIDRTPSGQSDMTARLGSPKPERDQDASPQPRKQPTFRQLDAPRKPPLSEREKADIWNDLLARSDKAGGTLHINGAAELMSDSMRLSTHSEV
ncbi:hypothetical protein OG21DRAFT_1487343 [Imleria badia]|nr:hypothetical protein OG21DRAFT_1487343 [Imleria badia]